jgi:hypothetical protein
MFLTQEGNRQSSIEKIALVVAELPKSRIERPEDLKPATPYEVKRWVLL